MTVHDLERRGPDAAIDLADIDLQARRYLLEPGDAPWDDVVRALRRAIGDAETDDLLRAVQIRLRTVKHL